MDLPLWFVADELIPRQANYRVSIFMSVAQNSSSTFLTLLKEKPYWGNYFWAKGYCVDTVGLDSDMIRKYVKYQEPK